ncbi:hypothetical protein CEXT_433901 [Caerostris extrusa]|uniref:Secreted protein n=1 Tax=Caerostris extrusa TaxID=172846 RepID=A0AAV4W923_CAEEX|nr:hypothetical protein CEXT_433901 [Caerostris extrusa]
MQISVRAAAKALVLVLTRYGNGFVSQIQEKTGKRFLDPSRKREHLLTRNETTSPCLSFFTFFFQIKAELQTVFQRDANRYLPIKLKSPQNWLLKVPPQ